MNKVYHKCITNGIDDKERERLIELANSYGRYNRWIDEETREIREYLPDICKDRRRYIKRNSNLAKLRNSVDELYFYTIVLCDMNKNWGQYSTIFDRAKVNAIKKRIKKTIKGPFFGVLEISAYSGAHLHLISGKQNSRYLKAEGKVYDFPRLVNYLSKSPISGYDKTKDQDEYFLMIGVYLDMKMGSKGKRLPNRSIWRF